MKIDNFFAELKRRNVYEVAITYAVSGMAVRACFFTGAGAQHLRRHLRRF